MFNIIFKMEFLYYFLINQLLENLEILIQNLMNFFLLLTMNNIEKH